MANSASPQYSAAPVRWRTTPNLVPYPAATEEMDRLVAQIRDGGRETVWCLEHPPLYTAGTSAKEADLRDAGRFPVFKSPRGGQYTYHGPGQLVAYLMLDLGRRQKDVRRLVQEIEAWLIDALAILGVAAEVREGRVGVWVDRGDGREDKIAAIGIRIRQWVTFHGISLNVDPDLEHFSGIVPCGIADEALGVTSLRALGINATMDEVNAALMTAFEGRFGPVETG